MKKTITLFVFLINLTLFSQEKDFFIVNDKKTFCNDLSFEITIQSYLKSINYTDDNGKKIEIVGRKNVPDISAFFIDGVLIDRIPQKVNKPNKYVKWAKRIVDGKLIVNYYNNILNRNNTGSYITHSTDITKHYVKMPSGIFYNLRSSKDRNQHVIPYLKKCEQFNKEYKGKFKEDDFNEIIKLYNRLCE